MEAVFAVIISVYTYKQLIGCYKKSGTTFISDDVFQFLKQRSNKKQGFPEFLPLTFGKVGQPSKRSFEFAMF